MRRGLATVIRPTQPVSPHDVAGHYDELDRFYRELWGEDLHHGLWITGEESAARAVEQLVERVARELGVRAGDRICDVGCGYGATARHLHAKLGADVTGLTISPKQHAVACMRSRGNRGLRFHLQRWESNALDDESFDALVSIECLAHVEDKHAYFQQVARVLRPGGKAVVTAWLSCDKPGRWERRWLLEPICHEGRLAGMGSEREYRRMAIDGGLEVVRTDDLSAAVRRTWLICAYRAATRLGLRPTEWRFLLSSRYRHTIFFKSVFRCLLAYHTGAMRYGLFVLRKPT